MSPVYLRKLMRVALVSIAAVLLTNFFAYYLAFTSSKENARLAAILNSNTAQRATAQRISNACLLILMNTGLTETSAEATRTHLNESIETFEKQQPLLLQYINQQLSPKPIETQLKIDLSNSSGGFLATAKEIATADSAALFTNAVIYTARIRQDQLSLLAAQDDITRQYIPLLVEKERKNTKFNSGKLVALAVALACLLLLAIEPLLRSNKNNLHRLQLAKIELLQEKKYLSSVLNSQTNYVIRLDRLGNFTFANPAFLKTFGYEMEEILLKPYYNTIFPKDIQRCTAIAADCWQNPGKIFRMLIRKPIKNSRQFLWTEWEFIALFNEDGSVSEIQGIGLDTTAKIEARQSSEEAIQTLSYAMGYARMGSWKYNEETGEYTLGAEMKTLLGLSEKDPNTLSMEDFVNNFVLPEDVYLVAAETEKIMRNRHDKNYESAFSYRIVTKQGQIRYLFVKGKRAGDLHRHGIAQDITMHKDAEQALLKSEQQYRLLAEHSEDIISVHSPLAAIEYISPSVQTVLGYTAEEVTGKNIMDFVHPEDQHRFVATAETPSVHTAPLLMLRYRMLHKNGSHIWLESIIKPVRENGIVQKLICTSRNITERKKTEAQKSRLLADVKQSEELLRTIIDATPDLIFIKDTNYRHMMVNKAYAELLQKTPAEIIGKNDLELGFYRRTGKRQ